MRKPALLLGLPTLIAVLAASGGAAAQGSATTLHIYAPFHGSGIARGVHVAERQRSYCWTASLADPRATAFRCFAGENKIHDPCFASGTGSQTFVLCPLPRPGSAVLKIRLTQALPQGNSLARRLTHYPPWAVRLRNGVWCERATGASGEIDGKRMNYYCGGPSASDGYLLGNPNRHLRAWTILYGPQHLSQSYSRVKIASAWW